MMNHTATIKFEHHVEAQTIRSLSEWIQGFAWAAFSIGMAIMIAMPLSAMLLQFIAAVQSDRLGDVIQTLDRLGYGGQLWLGLVLVPVAIAIIWWFLRQAYLLAVPLQLQLGARRRLSRKGFLGRHVYTLIDEELVVRDENGTVERFPWSHYDRLDETDSCFYLRRKADRSKSILIPKTDDRKSGDVAALRGALSSRI